MDSERQTASAGVLAPPVTDASRRKVLFLEDLATRWGCSVRTLQRRRKEGNLPIPELLSLDHRVRFAVADVEAYENNRLSRARSA